MKTSSVELMAPAGSWAALTAAVEADCDSVYLGVADFNMRATASANFVLEDLPNVVEYCHEHQVKVYVTVNTLLYNEELERMRSVVDMVKQAGGDAVIVADMATMLYARSVGMETHASTQLSISNTESLQYYAQFIDRVVLARELHLEQIKQISKDVRDRDIRGPAGELVELEMFAHGALCVAVSGRCGMSLYAADKSGNRGKCTQPCRRRYNITDPQTDHEFTIDHNYVMSSADLCTIGMLDEIVGSGINVLKLEGRGRSPMYVDMVVRTYREALQSIKSNDYSDAKIQQWNQELGTVFNRSFSVGLYRGRSFADWAKGGGNQSTTERHRVGEIRNFYQKIGVAEVVIEQKIDVCDGEEYVIEGPTTGVVRGCLHDMMLDEQVVAQAGKGDAITFMTADKVRKKDIMYVLREREIK